MDIALNHSFGLSPLSTIILGLLSTTALRPIIPGLIPVAKHAFNVGYDMNHESPATHYYFSRIVEHWLQQYRIDGFRFDLSKGFTQTQTCDGSGNNCNVGAWSSYDASRVAIWKGYYDTVQLKSPGAYAILEHFAADNEEIELSNYGMLLWGNMNYNFNEASMGWVPLPISVAGFILFAIGQNPTWSPTWRAMMKKGWLIRISHLAIPRHATLPGIQPLLLDCNEMCAAFFMTMPGPKMIWQFGELGYDYPINYCVNGSY